MSQARSSVRAYLSTTDIGTTNTQTKVSFPPNQDIIHRAVYRRGIEKKGTISRMILSFVKTFASISAKVNGTCLRDIPVVFGYKYESLP